MARILITDDDRDFAESAATWITQTTDWTADFALNADNAERMLRADNFDALLLDRNLTEPSGKPGRWGDDLFRDLRSDTTFDRLAVVFVTGYGTPQSAAEMVQMGAFQYLTKPVPLDILAATLRAAIAWQRSIALSQSLPANGATPELVLREIGEIMADVRPAGCYPLEVISDRDAHRDLIEALRGQRRPVLAIDDKHGTPLSPSHSDARSQLATRVPAPDGRIEMALVIESTERAFDPVWISVMKSFADTLSISYKIEHLKKEVWKSQQEAASEFRHGFSGRLQVLKNHSKRIASIDTSPLPEEARARLKESCDKIDTTVDRLAGQIKRLSLLDEERRPEPVSMDVKELIDNCLAGVEDRAGELGVPILMSIGADRMKADPAMLEEALYCLLANALDAIEDRRLVDDRERNDIIEVAVREAAGPRGVETQVSVHDTGIGFDDAIGPKLFVPFFTTKTDRPLRDPEERIKHQGIGLFSVRHITRLHGGDVSATSPGRGLGATFVLAFPILE
jgi:two-component system, cell cycle sensor histidine kinase and response regulator CckA